MPGIAGIISRKNGETERRDLSAMMACMQHDLCYATGEFVDEKAGLYAGWTCHRGSASDCMPIANEAQTVVLLLAGETYVDQEVIENLRKRGHRFNGDDLSYLVHLYEEKGEAFVGELNGMFSGVLLDNARGHLLLFNDRYGMGRFYCFRGKDEFLFSTEAKALLKIRRDLRVMDIEALAQLFVCDCPLGKRTLFRGVELLPPGSILAFRNGVPTGLKRYFDVAEWEQQPALENGAFLDELRVTFHRILNRYFRARQPIALSLTSGLDSRAILAHANAPPQGLPCFTLAGPNRESYDVTIARVIAANCGHPYQVVQLDEGFLSEFPSHARQTIYISDGYHDVCGSHDIVFNRSARQIAPIRMTGKFGSEIVGRQSMMRKPRVLERDLFHPDFQPAIAGAAESLREIKGINELTFAVFCEIPWHEYGRLAIESAMTTLRTPYLDNDLVKLMYRAPGNARSSLDTRLALATDTRGVLRNIRTDRGTAGPRIPFLSTGLRFLLYTLFKLEYAYQYELPHWLTRVDSLLRFLRPETLLAGRYQITSYRIWFRDELSGYVKDVLLDPRAARPYLNRAKTERIVRGHIEGKANFTDTINKLMTAELIHRYLIEEV